MKEEIRTVIIPSNVYIFFSNLMALTKLSYFLALDFKIPRFLSITKLESE